MNFAETLRARLQEYDDTIATPGQAQDIAEVDLLDDVRALVSAGLVEHPIDCGYCRSGEPMVHTYEPSP